MNIVWGFGFSLAVGGVMLCLIIDVWLLRSMKKKGKIEFERPDLLSVLVLGAIERFMYTSCVVLNVPHWIAVWLAFKVLTRWKRSEERHPGKPYEQVILSNIYLIGNLLTVVFGVIGGLICTHGFHIEEWFIFTK